MVVFPYLGPTLQFITAPKPDGSKLPAPGFSPQDIGDVIVPHSHAGHTGAAELWRTRYGVKIHLSEPGAAGCYHDP